MDKLLGDNGTDETSIDGQFCEVKLPNTAVKMLSKEQQLLLKQTSILNVASEINNSIERVVKKSLDKNKKSNLIMQSNKELP